MARTTPLKDRHQAATAGKSISTDENLVKEDNITQLTSAMMTTDSTPGDKRQARKTKQKSQERSLEDNRDERL